jgi:GDPmannose 4,6-dehydratase
VKTALIFGVTGQDGSILTDFLLAKGYRVFGVIRRTSSDNGAERIAHITDDNFVLLGGDITDSESVKSVMGVAYEDAIANDDGPLEVYNLAAQSHVRISFDQPGLTWDVTAKGAFNVLQAVKNLRTNIRMYQASSSEMFGLSPGKPISDTDDFTIVGEKEVGDFLAKVKCAQSETTPFEPRSPYGVAKLAAHYMAKIYRDGYKLFVCNGILFNHESERRCDTFVSRKITSFIGKLYVYARLHDPLRTTWTMSDYQEHLADAPKLKLGNLSAYRDWGYAPDFVEAMWLMLQQDKPDDYVIATGEAHSVKEFLVSAFQEGLGYYSDSLVSIDPTLYRAAEVNYLCGNATKAKTKLGWKPKTSFKALVRKMVHADINLACKKAGIYYE